MNISFVKWVTVAARIGQHANEKEFDRFYYIECAPEALDRTERAYISAMLPPMNRVVYR